MRTRKQWRRGQDKKEKEDDRKKLIAQKVKEKL